MDRDFRIIQNKMVVARATGSTAMSEICHYAMQYAQDGPLRIEERINKRWVYRGFADPISQPPSISQRKTVD